VAGEPLTRAKCAPGPSTGFPRHPRPRFYSSPPFPVLRGAEQRRAPNATTRLPTCPGGRSTDGMHTSRGRSRGYRLQNRCSFLHGVIDRGPAPCSRKHVCSCREKHKAPLPNSTGVRRTFIFCKDSAVWRADAVVRPSVLRLDLEATHRDRLFSATLAGTQTARATTLRTREKIKGNT
jgi:hypothetical protein